MPTLRVSGWLAVLVITSQLVRATVTSAAAAEAEPDADADGGATLRKTFEVKAGGKLEVRADRGSLRIQGGGGEKAEIEVLRRVTRGSAEDRERLLAGHEVRFVQEGGTVRVEAASKEKARWAVLGPNLEVEIRVTLPRRFAVDAETAGGSVRAAGLEGELALRTSGGSVQVEDLSGTVRVRTSGGSVKAAKVRGLVDLSTSGGSVAVEDAAGEGLRVRSSGGSLALAGIAAPVDAGTSGGSIRIEATGVGPVTASTSGGSISAKLAAVPKAGVELKTAAGGVEVVLPADAAFTVDAATVAGAVRDEFGLSDGRSKGLGSGRLKGPVNGGGPEVRLRTSAGGIRIRKN